MLGMTIALNKGELRYITVVMFTGRTPISTVGVWIQEWFGLGSSGDFRLDRKDEPRKATLEFSSEAPESERGGALRLSTKCFIQFAACKSAEDILPGVWQWSGGGPPSSFKISLAHGRREGGLSRLRENAEGGDEERLRS
jgi:hypothetical protein